MPFKEVSKLYARLAAGGRGGAPVFDVIRHSTDLHWLVSVSTEGPNFTLHTNQVFISFEAMCSAFGIDPANTKRWGTAVNGYQYKLSSPEVL